MTNTSNKDASTLEKKFDYKTSLGSLVASPQKHLSSSSVS